MVLWCESKMTIDYTDSDPEISQCPRCYQSVEIKTCKSICNNCGFKVRDCSDLA